MAIPRTIRFPLPLGVLLLISCAVPPATTSPPAPRPAPAVVKPRPQPVAKGADMHWTEMPATPGDWVWEGKDGQSVARFGQGQMELRCDRGAGQIALIRSGAVAGEVPMTMLTSSRTQTMTGMGDGQGVTVRLLARDPLLDAMAFSRGRFALEVAGLPTLYVPSWPEVSRVIEDCR